MAVPLKALGINSKDENEMMGLGWLHELPDIRDYSVETEAVSMILKPLKLSKISPSTLPAAVDMKNMFSPIENQQSIGSCTAHAGVGLVEYFEMESIWNTYRCIQAIPIQGNKKSDARDWRHWSVSQNNNGCDDVIWCPTREILAL